MRFFQKKWSLSALFIAAALVLSGCGASVPDAVEPSSYTESTTAQAAAGDSEQEPAVTTEESAVNLESGAETAPTQAAADSKEMSGGEGAMSSAAEGPGSSARPTSPSSSSSKSTTKSFAAQTEATEKTTGTSKSTAASTTRTTRTAPTTQATSSTGGGQLESYRREVLRLVNEERAKAGLSALVLDDKVSAGAQIRAQEIITLFDHTRPDGTSCFTVFQEVGISSYRAAAENIASGQRTPEEVMKGWMNSSGHRANILNPNMKKLGVGYAAGGRYGTNWVQLFTG